MSRPPHSSPFWNHLLGSGDKEASSPLLRSKVFALASPTLSSLTVCPCHTYISAWWSTSKFSMLQLALGTRKLFQSAMPLSRVLGSPLPSFRCCSCCWARASSFRVSSERFQDWRIGRDHALHFGVRGGPGLQVRWRRWSLSGLFCLVLAVAARVMPPFRLAKR